MNNSRKRAARFTLGLTLIASLALTAPAWAHHRPDHTGGPQPTASPTETVTPPPTSPEPSQSPQPSPTLPPLPQPTYDPYCMQQAMYELNPYGGMGNHGPILDPLGSVSGAAMLVFCVI